MTVFVITSSVYNAFSVHNPNTHNKIHNKIRHNKIRSRPARPHNPRPAFRTHAAPSTQGEERLSASLLHLTPSRPAEQDCLFILAACAFAFARTAPPSTMPTCAEEGSHV
jgi:hypothetical protein